MFAPPELWDGATSVERKVEEAVIDLSWVHCFYRSAGHGADARARPNCRSVCGRDITDGIINCYEYSGFKWNGTECSRDGVVCRGVPVGDLKGFTLLFVAGASLRAWLLVLSGGQAHAFAPTRPGWCSPRHTIYCRVLVFRAQSVKGYTEQGRQGVVCK